MVDEKELREREREREKKEKEKREGGDYISHIYSSEHFFMHPFFLLLTFSSPTLTPQKTLSFYTFYDMMSALLSLLLLL